MSSLLDRLAVYRKWQRDLGEEITELIFAFIDFVDRRFHILGPIAYPFVIVDVPCDDGAISCWYDLRFGWQRDDLDEDAMTVQGFDIVPTSRWNQHL